MSREAASLLFDEERVDAIFSGLDQCQQPGVAVGISIGGNACYRKAFGLACVELPAQLTPTMRMRIGSATKHFTALAYMLLCEEGLVGLDDPVGKFLPDLHPVVGAATIRSLITHTSGLRDVFELGMVFSGVGRPVVAEQYRALYEHIEHVSAAPGATWMYNNGGYVLLTLAIEQITGQPLEEVLRQRILEPVGMFDTLLRRWDSDFVPNSATLHVAEPAGGFSRRYMGMALGGEGGLVSTVDDMLRWLKHMDDPCVGTPETWMAMTSPTSLSNGASTKYGLGLMLHDYRGVATIGHPGTVFGGNSQILKIPSAQLDIVVMANRSDVSTVSLAEQIIDVLVPGLEPAPTRTFEAPATGVYFAPISETVIEFGADGGSPTVSINGAEATLKTDGALLAPAAPAMIGFRISPPVEDGCELITFGAAEPAQRMVPPATDGLDEIAGHYETLAPTIMIEIDRTPAGGRLRSTGPFGTAEFRLRRVSTDVWRFHPIENWPTGGILRFAPDRSSLAVSTARTSRLVFKRCEENRFV